MRNGKWEMRNGKPKRSVGSSNAQTKCKLDEIDGKWVNFLNTNINAIKKKLELKLKLFFIFRCSDFGSPLTIYHSPRN